MKLEVNENEAKKILADRWIKENGRGFFVGITILFCFMVIYVVAMLFFFPTLSNWAVFPPLIVVASVFFVLQYKFIKKAYQIAEQAIKQVTDD